MAVRREVNRYLGKKEIRRGKRNMGKGQMYIGKGGDIV